MPQGSSAVRPTNGLYLFLPLLAMEKNGATGNDRITEIGRCRGMEMNVEKTKVMRTSKQPFPIQIMTGQKQPNTVEYFNCLGNIKSTREIKSRFAMAKSAFNKKAIFTSKLDSNLRKKLEK